MTEKLCSVCNDVGDILGATCQVCAGGTWSGYDGCYMSFGGGVQSTAMAYLCINKHPDLMRVSGGELPSMFLFADTGDEPKAVYEHVERVFADLRAAGFECKTTAKGPKLSTTLERARLDIPLWVVSKSGKRAPTRRVCTFDWKVTPLDRAAKKHFKIDLRRSGEPPMIAQWLGISLDEVQRCRNSTDVWRHYIYPLVAMKWTRTDCVNYLTSLGITAPKSACTFCPFRSDELWASLPEDELAEVMKLERDIERMYEEKRGYFGKVQSLPTFHKTGIPIREKPWVKPDSDGTSGFDNECAGICGV